MVLAMHILWITIVSLMMILTNFSDIAAIRILKHLDGRSFRTFNVIEPPQMSSDIRTFKIVLSVATYLPLVWMFLFLFGVIQIYLNLNLKFFSIQTLFLMTVFTMVLGNAHYIYETSI